MVLENNNNNKLRSKNNTGCECPLCDVPACPMPEEYETLCSATMKTCPTCAMKMQKVLDICPHCGQTFPVP